MRIGIIGTGTLATALGARWVTAGHEVLVGGRSEAKSAALAECISGAARPLTELAAGCDALLLAVLWEGVEDVLATIGPRDGVPLIDATNAVEHGVGVLLTQTSGAQRIAELAPGAHVVKAFHLFPSSQWADGQPAVTVAMCGDDPQALEIAGQLVRDAGARPAVLGPLDRARQLEEVAGFTIGLAFGGHDPNSAIPRVESPIGG